MKMDRRKGRNKDDLYEKLEQLRVVTNSNSMEKASIISDASKYIVDLKQKVERLNQEVGTSQPASETANSSFPLVSVETLEKGFLVNVLLEKKCPGLLVSILEVFEDLGLDVLDARVSCADSFQFEAVGADDEGSCREEVDSEKMKEAILEAVETWTAENK